jgi:hypothetical protein
MQQFFTPAKFCYDLACQSTLVPWVTEFEELLSRDQDIAILLRQSGEFKPGMYVRQSGYWVLALNYEDLCTKLSESATFQIIVNLVAGQTFAAPAKLYRNGYPVSSQTATPGSNIIWVVTVSGSGGGGSGTTLELTDMFGTSIGQFLVV